MVDDIIVSARLDAASGQWDPARPPLHRSAIAVDDVVEAAADRFRTRWPDRVRVYAPADARTLVDGDPSLLRRALDNLLDNARKYSPDDAPIEIRVVRAERDVRVEVVDRGIGIAAEDKDRVFTAFFRADRSRTRTSGGVGLGLGLARRIVEAHGGAIGFDSELDRGSRFWLTLAVVTTAATA
jgi:two-component system, OmpR family, sensor kinase